jgi:hypothetical protein
MYVCIYVCRSDMILLLFDANKLDISDELKEILEHLRGHDGKLCIVLNKCDNVTSKQLIRVHGALMWALGKVLRTPEVVVYMCLCICICMCVCTYTYVYTCIHFVLIYPPTHPYVCMYTYIRMYVCMYVCKVHRTPEVVRVYVIHMCMYMDTCLCMYV